MVAPAQLTNLEALLAPIAGDNPAGENLTYAGVVDEIREARRADEDLEQGEWKRDLKSADWPKVVALASTALATRTKDLQIAAWLTEALVRLHGLSGLRDGLLLSRELLERYWDNLYPEIEDETLDARANALSWMNLQVAAGIKEVPIAKAVGGPNPSYLDYEHYNASFKNINQIKDESEREQAREELDLWNASWTKARETTSRQFYEELHSDLNQCWRQFKALDEIMDEKFGKQTPGLGRLKTSLDDMRSLVEKIVKEKRLSEPDEADRSQGISGNGESDSDPASEVLVRERRGAIRSREQALQRLNEVAEYFTRTEPHSPVSYLVQRAIKWGKMPLDSWLEDVIKDENTLERLRDVLGLKTRIDGERT
jgi:type VI secretion system protein ImpA